MIIHNRGIAVGVVAVKSCPRIGAGGCWREASGIVSSGSSVGRVTTDRDNVDVNWQIGRIKQREGNRSIRIVVAN